jgi:translation initiation factor IF-3
MTKQEALEKALAAELDLVEIAPNADPPVAKIVDFKKLRYEDSKKEKAAKKGGENGLKELWLSPRIADHDLGVRLKRTEEFLKDGHKVKLTVKYKGREMAHTEVGNLVLQKALAHFGERVIVEREPKMEGRKLSVIIGKAKGGQNNETKSEEIS